jgi:pyruvate formate lyase activating enzyme
MKKGPVIPANWWHRLDDGRVQCDLCPRDCKLHEGQRGFCFVRAREGDGLVLTTYGRSSGFCVDPIEKKPLHHFYPGSSVLSFGTAGCNLGCRFCQNWDISKARELDALQDSASPEAIAQRAKALGTKSVAFTYNDPTIFAEYAMDTADACHALGIKTVAVTAGYMHAEPRRAFYEKIDAANVDLKAFTNEFYEKQTFSQLAPVLETLEYLVKETKTWLEVTTLLIPTLNDSEKEVAQLTEWMATHLGPDVPLHFSAFHPDYKLDHLPKTPRSTLERARKQALQAGLRYVYTGNVHDAEGDTTFCPSCRAPVIERDWYELEAYRLDERGRCGACGAAIAGHFDATAEHFGRRRIPVRMASGDDALA